MASEIQNAVVDSPAATQMTTNEQLLDIISKLQQRQQELETRLKELEKQQTAGAKQNAGGGGDVDTSELIGAIDQGTTSSRFLIFNRHGEPVAQHQEEFRQIYPNPG
jgi:glycerol kinase